VLIQSVEDWERVMAVNLRGMFLCCRAAVPAMRTRGSGLIGSIVNTASPTDLLGYPDLIAYSASKGGVSALTRALAVELAPRSGSTPSSPARSTRASCRATSTPSPTATPCCGPSAQHPMGRTAEPEDVARAALFLASDDAAFVTGAALVVDAA